MIIKKWLGNPGVKEEISIWFHQLGAHVLVNQSLLVISLTISLIIYSLYFHEIITLKYVLSSEISEPSEYDGPFIK